MESYLGALYQSNIFYKEILDSDLYYFGHRERKTSLEHRFEMIIFGKTLKMGPTNGPVAKYLLKSLVSKRTPTSNSRMNLTLSFPLSMSL